MATVLFASDSHLSSRAPEALANWDTVADYVAETEPSLVIHLGDLTLDGPNDPSELTDARRLLDVLPAPWLAVPGNHDIGDNPWPGLPGDATVDTLRLEQWRSAIGADWWTTELDGWTLAAADAELAAAPPYRFVAPAARSPLGQLLADHFVPLVLSGHVHQYRDLTLPGRRHIWAPSTWALLPDDIQPRLGTERCGVLRLDLTPDGHLDATFVEPPGIAHLTLNRDIPDPGSICARSHAR